MQTQTAQSPFAAMVTKELLSAEDLAEMTGVTPATVRWWMHVGRAPRAFKIAGGRRNYFAKADVIAWLEESHAASAASA